MEAAVDLLGFHLDYRLMSNKHKRKDPNKLHGLMRRLLVPQSKLTPQNKRMIYEQSDKALVQNMLTLDCILTASLMHL